MFVQESKKLFVNVCFQRLALNILLLISCPLLTIYRNMEKLNFGYSLQNIHNTRRKKLQTAPLRKDEDIYQKNALESYLFYKQQQKSY